MYIMQATANAIGDWYRVLVGGDFLVASGASDTIGGGSLTLEFATAGDEGPLLMPATATFSAPIQSQVLTLARGTLVRAVLASSTAPSLGVFLQHTTIQSPTLQLVE